MIKKKTLLQKNCITFMFNKSYTSILCYCPVDTQPKWTLIWYPQRHMNVRVFKLGYVSTE